MKSFRFAVVLAIVIVMVLTSTVSAAGNKNLNIDLVFGQIVANTQYSKVRINGLPFSPSTLAVRTQEGNITWEQNVQVDKIPFNYVKNETAWKPTQYFGLNSSKGTYLSASWNKSLCPNGVSYILVGNGDSMKVKITNFGKTAMKIAGIGVNKALMPGKTVIVFGNNNSGGFGVLTKDGLYCSTLNWDIPLK